MIGNHKLLVGLVVGALVVVALVGLMGATPAATPKMKAAASPSLSYQFYDFFNVPYGEWWDLRFATYGDLPINADCFNATSITDGLCTPKNAAIPDYETYPYTNWYPLPGNLNWNAASNNPTINAPYRFRATGVDVPGYNRSEPVFLPVLNYSQPAGSRLDFDWKLQYLDKATGTYLTSIGCPGVDPSAYDGFFLRNQITLTMDLQESKRIFNVVGTDQASAQTWWNANTNPPCALMGSAETNVNDWFLKMAGGGSGSASVGKYDIANSYEWYYTTYYLQMTATVDADGTTHVTIDHAATGTEVMLARMFYWGNASYIENYLDSTKARGWWGMELAWFEDFDFAGSLGAPGAGFSFGLTTVLQYSFQAQNDPGPNGLYDRTDDIPYWTWQPILSDYTNNYFAQHPASELDRYPTATYVHTTTGSSPYGTSQPYDYPPIRWDLQVNQSWHFQFPTGNVPFYDPNLTPQPANPQGGFVTVFKPLDERATKPANYGTWSYAARTWDVVGPSTTGGPAGTPGPDGIPGTADDQYALVSWGSIHLGTASNHAPTLTDIVASSTSGSTGDVLSFSSTSSDADGNALSYLWTWGDTTTTSGQTGPGGGLISATHSYVAEGSYVVTLDVNDGLGGTAQKSISISIVPRVTMLMTVTSRRTEMMSGELATVRVNLLRASDSTPVTTATITKSSPLGGTFSTVRNLLNGNYEFDWNPPTVTRQTFAPINVGAKAPTYYDTTGRIVILIDPNMTNVGNPTQLFLLVRAPATSLRAGQTMTVTVYLYTIQGYVVSGATLNVVRVGPGSVSTASDQLNGVYTFVYTAPASVTNPTGVLITIAASKLGYANATSRLAITVTP